MEPFFSLSQLLSLLLRVKETIRNALLSPETEHEEELHKIVITQKPVAEKKTYFFNVSFGLFITVRHSGLKYQV